jgi:hypothetical protein
MISRPAPEVQAPSFPWPFVVVTAFATTLIWLWALLNYLPQ